MEREASRDWLTLAGSIQRAVDQIGAGRPQHSPPPGESELARAIARFDESVTNHSLRLASRELFVDGYFARAVEEAFKCLTNEVKDKAGLPSQDGTSMMRNAFSANSPILKLNSLTTSSEKDEQRGYMDLFAGAVMGIRNPRAHDHQLKDEPDVALEMIVLANHLMRKLEGSTKNK